MRTARWREDWLCYVLKIRRVVFISSDGLNWFTAGMHHFNPQFSIRLDGGPKDGTFIY